MNKDVKVNIEEQFKNIHTPGFNGIMKTYGGFREVFKSKLFLISIVFSLVISFLVYLSEKDINFLVRFIDKLSEIGISIDGGLIGLSLAGLTLVVTFGSGNFMTKIIELSYDESIRDKEFKSSIYQSVIAKFGFAVFVQVLTLLFLVGLKLIVLLDFTAGKNVALTSNLLAIFIGSLFLSYSLLLVMQMVVNIFTIGQKNHMIYYSEVTNKRTQEKNSENSN